MKTSTILRMAKRKLSTTKFDGICLVILCMPEINNADSERVTDMISLRVGQGYATQWLGKKVLFGDNKPPSGYQRQVREWVYAQDPKRIQAWRHAWLDQMIEEFEGQGD